MLHPNLPSKDLRCNLLHAKLSFFAYVISGEQSAIRPKQSRNDACRSKQVSLPKISSILQKMKIGQKPMYAVFAGRPSISKKLITRVHSILELASWQWGFLETWALTLFNKVKAQAIWVIDQVWVKDGWMLANLHGMDHFCKISRGP